MIKHFLKGILLIGTMIGGFKASAQDIHFSQYNASPLLLNPSLSGLNEGDYRAFANLRVQWPTISSGYTYRTLNVGGDMAIGKATKYNSFAGVGINFFSDQAGSLNYSTNRLMLTGAYHFMLNKNATQQLSAGLDWGFNYKSIDPSRATFDSQYDNSTGQVDPNSAGESFGRTNVKYMDAGLGVLYNAFFKRDINFYTGFALDHVNQPRTSFYPSGQSSSISANERLFMKMTIHGGMSLPIGTRMSLLPNYAVFVQGPTYEFDLGLNLKTKLGESAKESKSAISFGVQYRGLLDAVIFSGRLDYKGFSGGISYDINVSKLLPASKTVGAPELSLMFQGLLHKKPRPGHCPVI